MTSGAGYEVHGPPAATSPAGASGRGTVREYRSAERLRAEVEATMTEGVVVQRSNGMTMWCNQAATTLLQTTRERIDDKLMALHYRAIDLNGDPIPGENSPVTTTIRTGLPVRNSVIGIETDKGSRVWLRISSRQGSVCGKPITITSFNDVSVEVESRRELENALRQIGGAMIQHTWPESDRIEFAAASHSASPVGHDFLHAHAAGDDRHAFYIGTVCANATRATCAGSLAVHTVRSAATLLDDPESVIEHLDATLAAEWPEAELGLTVGYADIGTDALRLRLAWRATPAPVLIDDDPTRPTSPASTVDGRGTNRTLTLHPGQRLILGSHGATRRSGAPDLVGTLADLDPGLSTDELARAALRRITDEATDPIDDLSLLVVGAPRS